MGRKNKEHKQSKPNGTDQKPKSRSAVKFLIAGVLVLGVAAALVFGYGWGPSTSASVPQSETQSDSPVPLSTRGKSISGWHDMANIPKYTYKPPLPKGTPQPDVTVTPTNRDLGSVGSKDVVNLNYAVVNEGNEDLLVDSVVTSCGCTTAELSNSIIPPGRRADLKVHFDVGFHKMAPGEQVVRIVWMKTNDPDTPIAIARLTATIR
ncbi:MAG: DUF1573 domain-containing protein [Deltaproteobacteria bacterium]|nr:DUF1573 domain-containing protein [Deltaproteobacteria bacterium]MDZ4345100.1 DUF1573 domain-containing protein [Candidatus Binatia bacterium]